MVYFWIYDKKYQEFSYYLCYISAASIANISIDNIDDRFSNESLHILIEPRLVNAKDSALMNGRTLFNMIEKSKIRDNTL